MNKPNFLVLSGDGINCENETAFAFREAGGRADVLHINQVLENPSILKNYQGLAFPGGFSFGDELGSGQVLANKIKHGLLKELIEFIDQDKLVIGICNGFQVLTKLGLLPSHDKKRSMALAPNIQGNFIDKWVNMSVTSKKCVWTKDIERITLPVRHGEGRIIFSSNSQSEIYEELKLNDQIALVYDEDINGSFNCIAGVCNKKGTVLGLMPHPEAALFEATSETRSKNPLNHNIPMKIFKNAINYFSQEK
ncbi:MAG: phosphoribosylformylglycinamidine synthase subunit PurQ [Bacteriovoracaceae bacterium]|nr:phosphoribosylformylglycinamidine synthase subunit PurQ [Bacteriovoracaceae bacterium]